MENQDRRKGLYMTVGSQLAAGITLFTIIWAGGAAYQRLVYLESQVETLKHEAARSAELSGLEGEMRSAVRELELRLESDLKLERAFSRSICVALSHTQTAAGVPVTNDCERP